MFPEEFPDLQNYLVIPRGMLRPSELGPCCLHRYTKQISRIVALFQASLSLHAQKPSATGIKHQLLELSFLSPALPMPLPIISVLPLFPPAPHFMGLIFTNFQRKRRAWISIRKGSKAAKLLRCHKFHECAGGERSH